MGPGASGNGVRTETALGSGVSLHAYDIGVLVVYFVFVIAVGLWVSMLRGEGLAGAAEAGFHLWGSLVWSGSWRRDGQEEGASGKHKG